MRLWSLHPKYLDARGLVVLWREAVLRGETRGYKAHPQLERFRSDSRPRAAVGEYLRGIHAEATRRGYRFDSRKIGPSRTKGRLVVTRGQIEYEWEHLMRKLNKRAPRAYAQWRSLAFPNLKPLGNAFVVVMARTTSGASAISRLLQVMTNPLV